ncbi:MAG: hypothetical protein AAFU80_16365 [Pseudomonadota bacterium]
MIGALRITGLAAAGQLAKIAVPFPEGTALCSDAGDLTGWLLPTVGLVGALPGLSSGGLVGRFGAEWPLFVEHLLGRVLSLAQSTGLGFG